MLTIYAKSQEEVSLCFFRSTYTCRERQRERERGYECISKQKYIKRENTVSKKMKEKPNSLKIFPE